MESIFLPLSNFFYFILEFILRGIDGTAGGGRSR